MCFGGIFLCFYQNISSPSATTFYRREKIYEVMAIQQRDCVEGILIIMRLFGILGLFTFKIDKYSRYTDMTKHLKIVILLFVVVVERFALS